MPMSIGISICMIVSGIFAVLVIITCFVIKVVSEMDDEIEKTSMAACPGQFQHLRIQEE